MIKQINCNKKNYLDNLTKFLEVRRSSKKPENKIISKILSDIKKNKNKALIKYEKKFSKNSQIKPSIKEINNAIKFLDPKIKKAIDFALKRIFNFHIKQKNKNILYKDSLNNKIKSAAGLGQSGEGKQKCASHRHGVFSGLETSIRRTFSGEIRV